MSVLPTTAQLVSDGATAVASTDAQWASATATTLGVLVALSVAVWGARRDARNREREELRTACMRIAEWASGAQKAIDGYSHVRDSGHKREAIERSNRLTTESTHLLMVLGLKPPIRRTIDAAGMAYIGFIDSIGGAGEDSARTRWNAAVEALFDELRALGDYR